MLSHLLPGATSAGLEFGPRLWLAIAGEKQVGAEDCCEYARHRHHQLPPLLSLISALRTDPRRPPLPSLPLPVLPSPPFPAPPSCCRLYQTWVCCTCVV